MQGACATRRLSTISLTLLTARCAEAPVLKAMTLNVRLIGRLKSELQRAFAAPDDSYQPLDAQTVIQRARRSTPLRHRSGASDSDR